MHHSNYKRGKVKANVAGSLTVTGTIASNSNGYYIIPAVAAGVSADVHIVSRTSICLKCGRRRFGREVITKENGKKVRRSFTCDPCRTVALKATMTIEFSNDLKNYHNVDVEKELEIKKRRMENNDKTRKSWRV